MRTIIVVLVALVWSFPAVAEEKPTLTGTWDITRGQPEDKIAGFTLTLNQEGEKLTGTVAWPDGKTTDIADGVVKDGEMSFKARPNSVTHAYGGKIEGDKISGKWAAGLLVLDWEARRRVAEPLGGAKRDVAEKLLATARDSSDEKTRGAALHELRLLGRRVNFSGGKRERRGEEFAPQVTGLVPHLARIATKDAAEANRITALYAIADTLDPAAVAALRSGLRDEKEGVRFQAACLLTEFNDASGLAELKIAMKRIQKAGPEVEALFDLDRLVASFERITGKSFGEMPINPILLSDSRVVADITARRTAILNAWIQWWEWSPK